ncbi:MAG: hypothetical protein IKC36_01475 [Clostridia bacterium]|nr:hypothetical protein [Clostridia bacterium]
MSKKIIALLAAAVCMLCAFAGCNAKNASLSTRDNGQAVATANGGFLAETTDYVYFINGNELYTEDNTTGSVEKGALVRMAKADLEKEADERTVEVVASKLVSTSDYSAGISIFGDKVYFATPSNEKDKVGTVLNNEVQFCYTGLNGGDVKVFATAKGTAGNATAYRFNEVGGKVYVTFVEATTNDKEETVNTIKVVSADGTTVFTDEYAAYVFEKGATADHVYYTKAVENEVLDQPESFNEVYSYTIGNASADKLFNGSGSNRNDEENNVEFNNKGIQGVTFTLIAAENDYLYLSVANIDTSVSSDTFYAFVKEGTINGATTVAESEANYETLITGNKMNSGTSAAANVFAATSIFEDVDNIIYLDTAKGLCSYNYTKDNYENLDGVSIIYHDEVITTATLSYVQGDYLYYNVSGVFYQLAYKQADAEAKKLSPVAFATDWYAPEVVTYNNKEYVVGTLSSADYFDCVFALEVETEEQNDELVLEKLADLFASEEWINAVEPDEDDFEDIVKDLEETTYGDFISGSGRENALYVWKKSVSFVGETEKGEIADYIEATYPNSATEEVTEEEEKGCSSFAGAGLAVGGALVLLAGYAVARKRD